MSEREALTPLERELVEALKALRGDTRDMLFGPRGVAECDEADFYGRSDAALAKAEQKEKGNG